MKKSFYAIVALLLLSFVVKANPGDTTWVQAQNNIWLDSMAHNFDTAVQFPDGTTSYSRIYMIFTLGKYQCPGSPQYCGDWDYTVQNYLMTQSGDTLELGRMITPYANASFARFPWTFQQRYIYDVTDFYPLLKNNAAIRIAYSGYSFGFTADIKFAFIEGTPPRNVLGIDKLWGGSFKFGDATNSIDTYLPVMNKTAPANTVATDMKFTVTGHGSDNNYCSEFCKKYYQVSLNGNMIEQKDIWRDNCGYNDLYPQSGTWIYQRANWCPGALVGINTHHLTGITGGNSYSIGVNFEPYIDNGAASYIIESAVFYYGSFNKNLDASIEEIVTPNNDDQHFRLNNPSHTKPIIKIKNLGATDITSLNFEYGVDGGYKAYYIWHGTISSLDQQDIELPELWELRADSSFPKNNKFTVRLLDINGSQDDDQTNNTLTSYYDPTPIWPMDITIRLQTNKGANNSGMSQTNWYLIEGNGDTIAKRINNPISSTTTDTLHLGPSNYRLIVTDDGCDGLKSFTNSDGAGTITVRKLGTSTSLTLSQLYGGDFGCGFEQSFNVVWPTAISNVNKENMASIEAFPNPAGNYVNVALTGIKDIQGMLTIIDAMGRIVTQQPTSSATQSLNTSDLSNGVYTIIFTNARANDAKLQTRLIIAK